MDGAVGGGVPARGAALITGKIPKDRAIKYELALNPDKHVRVVHGNAAVVAKSAQRSGFL